MGSVSVLDGNTSVLVAALRFTVHTIMVSLMYVPAEMGIQKKFVNFMNLSVLMAHLQSDGQRCCTSM